MRLGTTAKTIVQIISKLLLKFALQKLFPVYILISMGFFIVADIHKIEMKHKFLFLFLTMHTAWGTLYTNGVIPGIYLGFGQQQ